MILEGVEIVKDNVRKLTQKPGVYRMIDKNGDVLYVGKAKNLRKRVASYAKLEGNSNRIKRMISEISSMAFLTTETEVEALLLEQNLIKELKPKYNVLLRDDKSFPYIYLSTHQSFPRLSKHRGGRGKLGKYYGPFSSAPATNRTINQLQKAFLLRTCTDPDFGTRKRACLLYQIKKCSAPCVGYISKEAYSDLCNQANKFLTGENSKVQSNLAIEMENASAQLLFEKAAKLRDRIKALTEIQSSQKINPKTVKDADLFALFESGDEACIQVVFIRNNKIFGNHAYFPKTGRGADSFELMEAFITQFYLNRVPPSEIILSNDLPDIKVLNAFLTARANLKVHIIFPKRGEKKELISWAIKNAEEELIRKLSDILNQKQLIRGLQKKLNLNKYPSRIEVYDNSHFQGKHALGAMIVLGDEGYIKSQYRKYNFSEDIVKKGDDIAMMKEMLSRRFRKKYENAKANVLSNIPELIIVDGGKAQVSAAVSTLHSLGVKDISVVGVAKGLDRNAGKEEIYLHGEGPFTLKSKDPILYFLQRIRDEAHRFAIGGHRLKRAKDVYISPLDEIEGIGSVRKKSLLSKFGSAKAVSKASRLDLKSVDGISEELAKVIFNHFRESN